LQRSSWCCWAGRRLRSNIGNIATLEDAVAAFNPAGRISGQAIIRVRP
jgi:hypothetical protein